MYTYIYISTHSVGHFILGCRVGFFGGCNDNTCTYIYIYIYTHTYIHTHLHTYTYEHICTYTQFVGHRVLGNFVGIYMYIMYVCI